MLEVLDSQRLHQTVLTMWSTTVTGRCLPLWSSQDNLESASASLCDVTVIETYWLQRQELLDLLCTMSTSCQKGARRVVPWQKTVSILWRKASSRDPRTPPLLTSRNGFGHWSTLTRIFVSHLLLPCMTPNPSISLFLTLSQVDGNLWRRPHYVQLPT